MRHATTNTPPSESVATAIYLRNVSKHYFLQKNKPFFFWEVFRRMTGRTRKSEEFWALNDLSVTVRHGESVGVIGRNGAGKSTLLGVLCGAIAPTTGTVLVNGRIGALLELGAGFHPDLTGRENVFLNASLLGMTEKETKARFDSILHFAELEEFIDVQTRNYSSGMHVRLGFAVAIHVDPEILLVDEALSVGDAQFQQKCIDQIREFKRRGKTLLFVSHGLSQISELCERVVWIDHGRVRADGPAGQVIEAFRVNS